MKKKLSCSLFLVHFGRGENWNVVVIISFTIGSVEFVAGYMHVVLICSATFVFFCRYVTYSKEEEAIRCIQSIHGFVLEGRFLR